MILVEVDSVAIRWVRQQTLPGATFTRIRAFIFYIFLFSDFELPIFCIIRHTEINTEQ